MTMIWRLWYRWSWRARYWWLDTRPGQVAHLAIFGFCCLSGVLVLTHMMIVVATVPAPDAPAQAVTEWVRTLVLFGVIGLISMMMAPKVKEPKPSKAEVPTVEDGLAVRDVFGTVWIDDQFLLAWKGMGTVKIKKKGGKK